MKYYCVPFVAMDGRGILDKSLAFGTPKEARWYALLLMARLRIRNYYFPQPIQEDISLYHPFEYNCRPLKSYPMVAI